MKNQIDIVREIADGMMGIGGVPNNKEFYDEFDMRVRAALNIDVSNRRELLLAYEKYMNEKILGKHRPRISKQMVDDFLANNCG